MINCYFCTSRGAIQLEIEHHWNEEQMKENPIPKQRIHFNLTYKEKIISAELKKHKRLTGKEIRSIAENHYFRIPSLYVFINGLQTKYPEIIRIAKNTYAWIEQK